LADPTDDAATHPGNPAPTGQPSWPAFIPHREIDGLLERIENAAHLEPSEAARLLRMISKEAQRLRAMALRMTTEKLAAADREASGILSEALSHADSMRSIGLATLSSRLDEADQLMATVREAFRLELRASDLRDA
jgi:hypothetical protein